MYQNHPFLLLVWITSVAPSSRPVSRYAPFQYVQIAPLFRIGSQTRSPSRFISSPFWPLASTTTFARTSRSVPSSSLMVTPTARSPSNSTSCTRTPSRASTPCSRAFSSIIWSNWLRTTCQVCEHS